jgi:hypothetical protein
MSEMGKELFGETEERRKMDTSAEGLLKVRAVVEQSP